MTKSKKPGGRPVPPPSSQELLASLSKDKKQQLVELLRKKELVKKERVLETFAPNPGVQSDFLSSPATIRAMFAGNATGKTTCMVIDLIWTHTGTHPHRDTSETRHTWLIVPSYEKAEDYWRELQRWCPPSELPQVDKLGTSNIRRFRWKNGSITTIFSHEQDSAKLEGTNISGLYFDEPPPRSLWVAAYRGLRDNPNYFVCIAGTPISEPWLYNEIYLPWSLKADPRIAVFQGSSYENLHVSKEFLDDFASRLTEEEREVRIEGKFAALQGRVYKNFNRATHVIPYQEWPIDWPVWVAIDPHSRKPHAVLWVGVTPDDNYVIVDELSASCEIAELAYKIRDTNKKYSVQSVIIDNSGVALDWSRSSAVQILSDNGLYTTPVKKSDKDIDGGIQRIKQLLHGRKSTKDGALIPQLKVMEHCVHLITEFENYSWLESKNPERSGVSEKPRKTFDEFLDCLRYIVNRTPGYQEDEPETITYAPEAPYNKDSDETGRRRFFRDFWNKRS